MNMIECIRIIHSCIPPVGEWTVPSKRTNLSVSHASSMTYGIHLHLFIFMDWNWFAALEYVFVCRYISYSIEELLPSKEIVIVMDINRYLVRGTYLGLPRLCALAGL